MAGRLTFIFQLVLFLAFGNICYSLSGRHINTLLNAIDDLLNEDPNIHSTERNAIITRLEQLNNRLFGKTEPVTVDTDCVSSTILTTPSESDVAKIMIMVNVLRKAFTGEKMQNARTKRDVELIKDKLAELKGEDNVLSEILLKGFLQMERYQVYQNISLHSLSALQHQTNEDISDIALLVQHMATRVEEIYNKTVGVRQTKHKTPGPRSCRDIEGGKSGGYVVYPEFQPSGVTVYCNMEIDGGGWIVFQRRQDGFVDFFRDWDEYKNGFGGLNWEFWLGNDNIHGFTNERSSELRIDLVDENGNRGYAKYDLFKVDSEENKYKLSVKGYSGNVGDSLEYHNNMKFSTKNMDNDEHKTRNCAEFYTGAWWYNSCHQSNLNGDYFVKSVNGPRWVKWHNDETRMTYQELKLRWKY